MNAEFDLAAERQKAESHLGELKTARGRAVLSQEPFDNARIREAEAALDALGEAEAEAARRRTRDAAEAHGRLVAEKGAECHATRQRYLEAIGRAQVAAGAFAAAVRDAVEAGEVIVRFDDELRRLSSGVSSEGFRTTRLHDRDAILERVWGYWRPVLQKDLGSTYFGPVQISRSPGDPAAVDDWQATESALDDRSAERALIP